MGSITTLFWDIGGVLLTDGWDTEERRAACQKFGLEPVEFEERHRVIIDPFEKGELPLDQYLDETVFYRSRQFTRREFKEFMFAQSKPNQKNLMIARQLARSGRYLMAALNNESLDLNIHRIERFELRSCLSVFFTSCFLGTMKPEEKIYRLALQVTQRPPEECLFIDDRPVNLQYPQQIGMQTIHYQDPAQLRRELGRHGIAVTESAGKGA